MSLTLARDQQVTAWKSDSIGNGVGFARELPHRADQCRTALHARMGNILKIVGFDPISEPEGRDRSDDHPVAAMGTGEE
jgi:hypothetical protein